MDARTPFILPPRLDPLKDYSNWVVWKYEQVDGAWKKPPFTPRPPYNHKASVNDPTTWGSFAEAQQTLSLGSFDGLGFDFLGANIAVFDLDKCRNKETGVVLPEALSIVHRAQSYTEISPSGTGLKIFGTGSGAKLHENQKVPNSSMKVESWRNCERYTTVTGIVLPGTEQYQLANLDAFMDDLVSYLKRIAGKIESAPLWVHEALSFDKKGERSEEFFRVVTYLHEQGWSVDDIGMLLTKTPLAAKYEKEGRNRLRKQIEESAAKSNPQGGAGQANAGELIGRSLENVVPRGIKWIWKGWIPKGYITLFVGETGSAKTTVIADAVSRVTNGMPWPGETVARPPKRVLWLGSEDGIEEMTVPRLIACDANRANVIEIQGVKVNGQRNTFSMQDDIGLVEQWLEFAENEGKPFDVLVIDPITSYLGSRNVLKKVDLSKTGQLRPILERWFVLAQKYKLAIIGVTHFSKDTSRSMLHRVIESGAFAQTCRSLVAVVDMENDSEPYAKAMMQVKINLPEHPGGAWRFNTEKVYISLDDEGTPIFATRPVWKELDKTLNPKNAIGPSRGPKSQFTPLFGFWVKTYFEVKKAEWLLVDDVRGAAIRENMANDRWWKDHSGEYLEKKIEDGVWWCRLKKGAEWKGGN